LRSLTAYFATYPPSLTARHIGWLADVLDIDASTVTFELAAGYRVHAGRDSPRVHHVSAEGAVLSI
jgi:hypothetical protein